MAGTIYYRLKVGHIYQRRFGDSETLATALGDSHWYVISRRPTVRILEESARIDDNILTADFITRSDFASPNQMYTFGSDFSRLGRLHDFKIYEQGAYFSVNVNDCLMHGDAWALAALLSHADAEIARQEVLYIGQAFGRGGSRNAWERTRKHEKLQRIYEQHVSDDCEIFVSTLSLDNRGFISDDHIDDDEDGPMLSAYYDTFVDGMAGPLLKPSVDLIEHGLISYFVPPYNEFLREWRIEKPTDSMQKMRSAGFRLLHVYLSGWWGLARYHSAQEPDGPRSHFISHDFPPPPRRPVLRGISASSLSTWRMGAQLAREGKEIFASKGEMAGVALSVFGDTAPEVRKPPGVDLPPKKEPDIAVNRSNADAHDAIRSAMHEAREAERKRSKPRVYSGRSTYNPEVGSIEIGESLDGSIPMRVRLHDPGSSAVDSVLILGNPQSGKSNALRVMIFEALLARRFIVIPCDPSDANNFAETWRGTVYDDRIIATSLDATIANLNIARHIIDDRLNKGYRRSENAVSDMLVAIDDSDIVLQDELGARLIVDLLQRGGAVGVGLLIIVSDVSKFLSNSDLMYELVSCSSKVVLRPGEPNYMTDLVARYGDRRLETWRDGVLSFVLHRGISSMGVGVLTAVVSPGFTASRAKKWCKDRLTEAGIAVLTEWRPVMDDPCCWYIVDALTMKIYALHRHSDNWALVMNISSSWGPTKLNSADMISWADGAIDFRFTVSRDPWQAGPTTLHHNSLTLYADIKGEIIANDTSDAIRDALLELY